MTLTQKNAHTGSETAQKHLNEAQTDPRLWFTLSRAVRELLQQ